MAMTQDDIEKRHEQALGYIEKSNVERWTAHAGLHEGLALAIDKADSSQRAALKAALDDHHREHAVHETSHAREHAMNAEAIRVADVAMTARLESLNEFREQLRDQAKSFASSESVQQLTREFDRRIVETQKLAAGQYETNRQRIEMLEKGDVKQEGRGLGQAGVIAAIVVSITAIGTVLGIIIILMNLLSNAG